MAASTSGTTCPVTVRYTTLWGTTSLVAPTPKAPRSAGLVLVPRLVPAGRGLVRVHRDLYLSCGGGSGGDRKTHGFT